jgi:hypothetical protein
MTAPREADPADAPPHVRSPILGTLPLIVLTGALFVGAYFVHQVAPTTGPYNFPLWGLLMTLGFIAAIGAVVSWFFATDEPSRNAPTTDVDSGAGDLVSRRARGDFGRPVPEVARAATPSASAARAAEPWNEDLLPPVAPHRPRPVLTTPDDPGDIARALDEIADIQRELAAPRSTTGNPRESPARA